MSKGSRKAVSVTGANGLGHGVAHPTPCLGLPTDICRLADALPVCMPLAGSAAL